LKKKDKEYLLFFTQEDYEHLGTEYLEVVEELSKKIKIQIYSFKINNAICMVKGELITLDNIILEKVKHNKNIKVTTDKGLISLYFKIYALREVEMLFPYISNILMNSAIHSYSLVNVKKAVKNFSYYVNDKSLVTPIQNTRRYNEKKLFENLKQTLLEKKYLNIIPEDVQYKENTYGLSQKMINYKVSEEFEISDVDICITIEASELKCTLKTFAYENKKMKMPDIKLKKVHTKLIKRRNIEHYRGYTEQTLLSFILKDLELKIRIKFLKCVNKKFELKTSNKEFSFCKKNARYKA